MTTMSKSLAVVCVPALAGRDAAHTQIAERDGIPKALLAAGQCEVRRWLEPDYGSRVVHSKTAGPGHSGETLYVP